MSQACGHPYTMNPDDDEGFSGYSVHTIFVRQLVACVLVSVVSWVLGCAVEAVKKVVAAVWVGVLGLLRWIWRWGLRCSFGKRGRRVVEMVEGQEENAEEKEADGEDVGKGDNDNNREDKKMKEVAEHGSEMEFLGAAPPLIRGGNGGWESGRKKGKKNVAVDLTGRQEGTDAAEVELSSENSSASPEAVLRLDVTRS